MGEGFVYALVTGAALGVLYDFLRFIRLAFNSRFFIDFLFWILSAFAVFSYLIIFNSGAVRAQPLILILLGFIAYIFTLGKITVGFEKAAAKKIKNRLKSFKKVLQLLHRVYYNIKVFILSPFKNKESREVSGEKDES